MDPALSRSALDEIAPDHTRPDAVVVAKGDDRARVSRHHPASRPTASGSILRDVLDYSAAGQLALDSRRPHRQRPATGQVTLRERRPDRGIKSCGRTTDQERVLVERLIEAHGRDRRNRTDARGHEDRDAAIPWRLGLAEFLRLSPAVLARIQQVTGGSFTRANRQPAAGASRATGDTEFRAFKIDVMRFAGGLLAESRHSARRCFLSSACHRLSQKTVDLRCRARVSPGYSTRGSLKHQRHQGISRLGCVQPQPGYRRRARSSSCRNRPPTLSARRRCRAMSFRPRPCLLRERQVRRRADGRC